MNRREFNKLIASASLAPTFPRASAQTLPAPARFHFSVMLWTIDNKLPIEHCMEIVAAAGYNGVELVSEFKKWSAEDTRRMKAKMHSLGLVFDTIAGLDAGFCDPDGLNELLEKLTTHIGIAKNLGCRQIILLSGKRIDSLPRKSQHLACIENLKHAGDLASKHNIQLVIEPIDPLENPPIYLTSVTEGFEIIREVGNPHVKVLYDFYHEQRASGNLIEKLENNIDSVGLVHVADVPGRHEPGTGEIDYRNIYRTLARLNYNKFIAMEYYPTGDPLESIKTARLVALESARSLPSPYKLSLLH